MPNGETEPSESEQPERKSLEWVASAKRDLRRFPKAVRCVFGFALLQAELGGKHVAAKPMKGFGGAGVLEIVEDNDGSTYRVVYTVKFAKAVYVLHSFQKKSKQGVKTPKPDIERIRGRLKTAKEHYEAHYAKGEETSPDNNVP